MGSSHVHLFRGLAVGRHYLKLPLQVSKISWFLVMFFISFSGFILLFFFSFMSFPNFLLNSVLLSTADKTDLSS
jgi:hypothetical protein